jgi:hypothetical protein
LVVSSGIEPKLDGSKPSVLPLHHETTKDLTAGVAVALEKLELWFSLGKVCGDKVVGKTYY